jgi:hypothetical protein
MNYCYYNSDTLGCRLENFGGKCSCARLEIKMKGNTMEFDEAAAKNEYETNYVIEPNLFVSMRTTFIYAARWQHSQCKAEMQKLVEENEKLRKEIEELKTPKYQPPFTLEVE